jgi:hypothetical protein
MSNDIRLRFVAKRKRLGGLKGALLRGPRKAKRRVSLRIRNTVVGQVRMLALQLGMPVTELYQMLIQLAAIATFLRLEDQKGVDDFRSSVKLSRNVNALSKLTGDSGDDTRILAEGGEPVSLRFPGRFLETVGLYARLTGQGRSDLLLRLLEQGLRIYLRGWVAVTKTLAAAVEA